MTAHYHDHGYGLETLIVSGPARATLTTWLHGIEVETLTGRIVAGDFIPD